MYIESKPAGDADCQTLFSAFQHSSSKGMQHFIIKNFPVGTQGGLKCSL